MLGKRSTGSTSPSMPAHTHTSSNIFDRAKGEGTSVVVVCYLLLVLIKFLCAYVHNCSVKVPGTQGNNYLRPHCILFICIYQVISDLGF